MLPNLTAGSINKILEGDGDEVTGAIVQILGYKKIPGTGNDRYRLLISDGVTACPFAILGSQLNSMITNEELEQFTIIRVDKCVCNQINTGRKVIILLNLVVLVPGAEVGERISNPINYSTTSAVPTVNTEENKVESAINTSPKCFSAPQASSSGQAVIACAHAISSLSPYHHKWTIKARVTFKTSVRTWSNSRGEGKFFSVNFLDESGEIRATGFNDAVDKFHELLELNKVYYVSRATIKIANKNYNTLNNDYEMTFNADTNIVPCKESSSSIPMMQYDFVPIANIENIENDAFVDVIGVCKSAGEVITFVARTTNKEYTKRDIIIVDQSNKKISLTLWGKEAEKFEGNLNPVVAVKGAKVSDFMGRSLSVSFSSTMQINPDIPEAHFLKDWFNKGGFNTDSESLSSQFGSASGKISGQWKTFAQVNCEQLGMGDKPEYYITKATVVGIRKDNSMYMGCLSDECKKKVTDLNNGSYHCVKCDKEYTEFKWRLMLSVSLADFTENLWVTCFQETAEAILGLTAQELGLLKETDEDKFNKILDDANFKSYIFKLRTKMETYNEESRVKTIAISATPVDSVSYTKKLLSEIKQLQEEATI